jgi:hypothetical protein
LSQCFLASLVIPGDAVSCINTESAVAPVHELADEIIGYLALAFQHGQDTGPEDLLKLFHVGFGEHIKGPVFSEKAINDYGMKMGMKPGVISKGVNDHHKAWNFRPEGQAQYERKSQDFPLRNGRSLSKAPGRI